MGITTDGGFTPAEELIAELLNVARTRLDMDVAYVCIRTAGDAAIEHLSSPDNAFGLAVGMPCVLPTPESGRPTPLLIADAVEDGTVSTTPALIRMGVAAVACAPIGSVVGETRAELCCLGTKPSRHLADDAMNTLVLLGDLIGTLVGAEDPSFRRNGEIRFRVEAAIAGELMTPVFQPIVEPTTGTIVGAEALTRFSGEPSRPDVWFNEARSVGLGVELELAAVRSILGHLSELPEACYLAINVSPDTMCSPELVALVAASIPERLVVELTEHAAISDYGEIIRRIATLRETGARIAVDDVGAGFSSFTHVLQLQPDIIKVDMSITRGIQHDSARQGLARAIVDVASGLGATVVAEGVEDDGELDAVAQIGIEYVQGYRLAAPGPLPLPEIAPRSLPETVVTVDSVTDLYPELAEQRFELALLHSPIGIAIVSLDGHFLHANPALERMFGRTTSQLGTMCFQDITHPDDLGIDLALLSECIEGHRTGYRIDKRYSHANGSMIWASLSVVLVRSGDGLPLYFISQILEATDDRRREAEKAVRADSDPLTGLATRTAALGFLDGLHETSTGYEVTVCTIRDLEELASDRIDDLEGCLVAAIANRLRPLAGPGDLFARFGPTSFLFARPCPTASFGELIANVFERPVAIGPDDVYALRASVGHAHFDPTSSEKPSEVLDRATIDDDGAFERTGPTTRQR